MEAAQGDRKGLPRRGRVLWLIAPAGLLLWLSGWILKLGPTLINDEYAAIDYFYRIVEGGVFYPTPEKFHKPMSLLMGVFAWAPGSPLGYEFAVAALALAYLAAFYLVVRREFGPATAALAALAVALHPDLMYYVVTGSTVIPFNALVFVAIWSVVRRHDFSGSLWVYSVSCLLAGLYRPEAWLFGVPMLWWWWPGWGDRKGLAGLVLAGSLMALGPLLWFGKDLLINGDFFHSFNVASRLREVSTVKSFTPWSALATFPVKYANRISWPTAIWSVAGMVVFVRERGLKEGLTHPFLMLPALVSFYVWLVVVMGVYPVERYWYFDSIFAITFSAYLLNYLLPRVNLAPATLVKTIVFFVAALLALGYLLARPASHPSDGRWLLVAVALAALAVAVALLYWRELISGPAGLFLTGAMVLASLAFVVFVASLYAKKVPELMLEAKKQRELVQVSSFLKGRLPEGSGERILLPSHRNEQLEWEWRDREVPEVLLFSQVIYLYYKGRLKGEEWINLHPDWIVYTAGDFQFWGPDRRFGWLGTQDRTVLGGVEIDLAFETELFRVFHLTYPPGFAPRGPLPPIP